jgi:nucleotide-binding universal stress UspA family protein
MTENHARDWAATTGEWAQAHSPVVVGVDGSDGSRSALEWAAGEAARAGADLRLVTVVEEHAHAPRFPVRLTRKHATEMLDDLAPTVHDRVPPEQVSTEVYGGRAEPKLLALTDHARMLVVGKRGLSAIPRLIVGSTSLAVAGRAAVPVAVVPTGWDQKPHADQPIVVGVDPYRGTSRLLHLAFRRAGQLGVPLVAVHGWEAPGAPVWTDSPVDEWERESHQKFEREIETWRERFPEVELRLAASGHHPAVAVLDEAEKGAQLVLLGRHSTNRLSGFAFGSVTRAVLHYSAVPVLVVPTDED